MQDEIEIRCPKCHSLNMKFCFEQKDKLRLAFECQQCFNHFFAIEDVKVKDFNLKTGTISINISIDKPKISDEELDAKIIQFYKAHDNLSALTLYIDERNSSFDEALKHLDNLTEFIEKDPIIKSETQIINEKIVDLIQDGKRYSAIKFYKEKTNSSWLYSSSYVNQIINYDSETEGLGCFLWFVLITLLGLIVQFFQWAFS